MSSPEPAAPALTPITVGAPLDAVAAAVTALVNEVYDATEGPLWSAGVQRTDVEQTRALLASGQLLVALSPSPDADDDADADADDITGDEASTSTLLGAVCVKDAGAGTAEFGMLAVAPHASRRGLGAALVCAAEEHARAAGAVRMEIVVLRPATGALPAKERLGVWYPRLGYRLTSTAPVGAEVLPTLDLLAVDCLVDTYERDLTQEHL